MRVHIQIKARIVVGIILTMLLFSSVSVDAKRAKPKAQTPTSPLGQFVAKDNIGEVYSKVIVNLKKDVVYADGVKTDLQEVLGISESKENKLLDASPKKVINFVEKNTVGEAEKLSENKVVITNNFQTNRLLATVEKIENTYGAIRVAKGITAYMLKYESPEDTKEAYEKLVDEYGEGKIFYDEIFNLQDAEYNGEEEKDDEQANDFQKKIEICENEENDIKTQAVVNYTSDGCVDTAKTMGLYSINQQINSSKYANNEVFVAILDSGLTYTTNPTCEIGIKLRDKVKEEWCYDYTGLSYMGDGNGHGTQVSSVIAYNTPDNVKYCVFRVADSNGSVSMLNAFAALEQAYVLDIDIVNCSFGSARKLGEECNKLYDSIFKKLYEKGTIVCCAAGNDNNHRVSEYNGVTYEYDTSADYCVPANSDYVLCISALDATAGNLFSKAAYTNTGNTVDYSAIGTNVYVYTKDSKESWNSGTSFSTPLVAAEFAMIKTCMDSFKTIPEIKSFYDLYLNPYSVAADSTIYGAGYFDITGGRLCLDNHSKCCGLWYYIDGSSSDLGVPHKLTIDFNGGKGYGNTNTSTALWTDKFTRNYTCGSEICFASAYTYQPEANGWIQFGETEKAGSGTATEPYIPYREGYMFVGWKCSGIGAVHKRIYYINEKYTETWWYNGTDTEDVTLTAQWMPKNLYNTLVINPDGGEMYKDDSIISSSLVINYRMGEYRVLCDSNNPGCFNGKIVGEPRRTGYTFDGWISDMGSGSVHKIINQSAYFTNEFYGFYETRYAYAYLSAQLQDTSASIRAKWIPNIYIVNLKLDNTNTIASHRVTYDKAYGSILDIIPEKEGYTFDGWYTSRSGGKKVTAKTLVQTAKDHDLYPHWIANTYKVTLKANKTSNIFSNNVTYGDVYGDMLKYTLSKEGYTFDGWYTELEGGKKITPTTKVTTAKNHNLYPHWKVNE